MSDEESRPKPAVTVDDLRLTVEVQQLAINRLTGELAALADQVTEAAAGLQDQIGDLVTNGRATASPPSAGWCWRDLDDTERRRLLAEVADWLTWLVGRYPLAASIPPCWHRHPEMVEEIIAAHRAWAAAYRSPGASPTAPAEWHERWLPGLEQRLTGRWKSRRCDDGHHPTTHPTWEHR